MSFFKPFPRFVAFSNKSDIFINHIKKSIYLLINLIDQVLPNQFINFQILY